MSKTCQDVIDEEFERAKLKARDIYLGTAYLISSNKDKLGKLIEDTNNKKLIGNYECPKSLTNAYNVVSRRINNLQNSMKVIRITKIVLDLLTLPYPEPMRDPTTVTCFSCKKMSIQ